MSVVPREVRARRHFSAGAIGLALFVFGKVTAGAAEAARVAGSWASPAGAWRLLRRWIAAVDSGALFPGVRASPPSWAPRRRAERIAMTLVAHAPSTIGGNEPARAFAGAALAR